MIYGFHARFAPVLAAVFISFCLFGCASATSADVYKKTVTESIMPDITLSDRAAFDDVNGFLPQNIYLNTMTQTQCMGYEFCLVDGHIYSKKKEEQKWKLFLKTGLPFAPTSKAAKNFPVPERIVELSADADSLVVFSSEGYMYQCFLEKVTVEKPWQWKCLFGWPSRAPLKQNVLVSSKRGWCMAARRGQVLWYEDIFGNQHHYGTMGLETFYFLAEDGQSIRFTDSGLPADFSHTITNPERGAFIASNISASASTIFLINENGEMYTRLIDFDTMGCDPMFFKYTYKNEKQPFSGREYRSNFSNWGLPAEDWRAQAKIPLAGKARLSRHITILQNGQGNDARELRVAGLSAEGKAGFYHKQLLDSDWHFTEAPLVFHEESWLTETARESGTSGAAKEIAYQGILFENGAVVPGITCRVPDFLMSEGFCTLHIAHEKINRRIKLHPVEVWTYQTRFDPGFDSTPKHFFITPDFLDSFLDTPDDDFTEIMHDIFGGKDRKLFCARAEATEKYLQILFGSNDGKNEYRFFLTADGEETVSPDVYKSTVLYEMPYLKRFYDEELRLDPQKIYSVRNLSEIKRKIESNKKYMTLLQGEIDLYKKLRSKANRSRWGYNAAELFATVTLLRNVDFPKIKTVIMFGSDILDTNYENNASLAESRGWIYSHLITLLKLRIKAYEQMTEYCDSDGTYPAIDGCLRDSFREYFEEIGFPLPLAGTFVSQNGICSDACLLPVEEFPVFPGFLIRIEAENAAYILAEANDIAEVITARGAEKNTASALEEEPLKVNVRFRSVHNFFEKSAGKFAEKLEKSTGTLIWNGTQAEIRVPKSISKTGCLFVGLTRQE
ncbi:MAG: hypothetical protein NC041_01555 [Bacteroides sp.]|nr:hypothetical protein [Prevotella sp.]MCM1407711.1 hypothetical protein [Treponema brennaborense]MCM1469139.1 hypothetical protein [Bacteroides sp.]